jgi:thioredoxin-like negative regulator of GroEL
MMSEVESQPAAPGRASKVKGIVVGRLLLMAAIVVMNLPKGFSDDLSRIGKGKAVVVLVRDKATVQSQELINLLNGIRNQYAGKVEFLLTDFDTPEGRAFMAANNAVPVTLVLFDAGGREVKILNAQQAAGSVQQEINAMLGTTP